MTDAEDPLMLRELFKGGEAWLPSLKPAIEALPDAHMFIGPSRNKSIVPLRELTFQALKPNAPAQWKVVAFGQNPYPRVESATGIAMFDNQFNAWSDGRFGSVTSIRCIVKAACMWKHGIEKATPVAELRRLLAKHDVVQPPEWFQAMLTQGVLLMNAALTASSDDSMTTAQHTTFWKSILERVIDTILQSKAESPDPKHKGVVFAWWGAHAKALRSVVEKLARKYPSVSVIHLAHPNPAAQGDVFCDNNHFGAVNDALATLAMDPIDWLPSVGWKDSLPRQEAAARMGEFIAETMDLHKLYLDRLQGAADEELEELAPIDVMSVPLMSLVEAAQPILSLFPGLGPYVARAIEFGRNNATEALGADDVAALHLYTLESALYRQINAALRHPERERLRPYLPYLRLFFSATAKLVSSVRVAPGPPASTSLWRGVAAELRAQYQKGASVVWWGVSSCTPNPTVARAFLGSKGRRTLFEVVPASAVSIRRYSAFHGEDEYVLPPGTRLAVEAVKDEPSGLSHIRLRELPEQRMVR